MGKPRLRRNFLGAAATPGRDKEREREMGRDKEREGLMRETEKENGHYRTREGDSEEPLEHSD